MAEEKKEQPKQNTFKAQSTIKKIKEPDFSKEVTIDRLVADKQAVDFHFNRMKKEFGDKLSDQDIQKRIHNMVVRDNIFNAAMHIIVPCYEIKIDPADLQNVTDSFIKADPRLAKAPYEYVKTMATRLMEKEMLFSVLAKE
ncbi:MAG: phage tail assembly chaperone [Mycoplasmoidaceae bacterium]|nr:phage tail assembly chaperone [Mycoplasmoidaceae bacterium]